MSHSGKISIHKSDKASDKHREAGNSHFVQKEFQKALIYYNKAITYANTKNVICLAYANRSAVFFELKRYEECLKNIEWARENKYPASKMSKLDERENKCKELMAKTDKPEDLWKYFKLSYPANEKIPWIANCIEMRTTEKFGRGIYATKDLKAGDVICVDEPIINGFMESSDVTGSGMGDSYYMHCYHCFKSCMLNLIPCIRTNAIMFCSTECRQKLYAKGLNMDTLLDTFMCENVKTLAVIMDGFGGKKNFDDFLKHNDIKTLNKTIFDYDFSNADDPKNKENLVKCFLSLKSTDYMIGNFCLSQSHLPKEILHHILGIRHLNQQFTYYSDIGNSFAIDGKSISVFVGLLNHSCLPNVNSFSIDNKVSVVVLKPIKAGEQLFRSYCNHIFHTFGNNLLGMTMQYDFNCDCKACTDDDVMKFFPIVLQRFPTTFMSRDNLEVAKDLLKEGNHYINTNSKTPEEIKYYIYTNFAIFEVFAYYSTFPC
jgi:tetratricopeptide (TPR) repeat protein